MKVFKKLAVLALVLTMIAGLFPARSAQAATKPAKAKVTAKANDDGTSVTLTIAKTKNAQGYKIMVKKPGAKKFTKLAAISEDGTAKRTYTAEKLTEGEYQFKVRAYLKNGKKTVWGKYSKVAKVKVEKPAAEDTGKDDKDKNKEQKTGNRKTVTFGKFEQDNDPSNGAEPIEWIVLEDDGAQMLLLSKYILDFRYYNEVGNDHQRWDECSVRKFLNGEFYDDSFTDAEKAKIIETELVTNEDPTFAIDGYPEEGSSSEGYYSGSITTRDKVFLLSLEDVVNPEYGLLPKSYTFNLFFSAMERMNAGISAEQFRDDCAELRSTYTKYAEYSYGIVRDNGFGETEYSEESVEFLKERAELNATYYGYGDLTWKWWLRDPAGRKRKNYMIGNLGGATTDYDQIMAGTRPAIWITK